MSETTDNPPTKVPAFEYDYGAYPIRLIQNGRDNFSVTYGLQVKTGLDYNRACTELGACILHSLSCDGKIDNRE